MKRKSKHIIWLTFILSIAFLMACNNPNSLKKENAITFSSIAINVDESIDRHENLTGIYIKIKLSNNSKKMLHFDLKENNYLQINNDSTRLILKYINGQYLSKYDSIKNNNLNNYLWYKIEYPFGVVLSQMKNEFEEFVNKEGFNIYINSITNQPYSIKVTNQSINFEYLFNNKSIPNNKLQIFMDSLSSQFIIKDSVFDNF